jgi:hypothetical protein
MMRLRFHSCCDSRIVKELLVRVKKGLDVPEKTNERVPRTDARLHSAFFSIKLASDGDDIIGSWRKSPDQLRCSCAMLKPSVRLRLLDFF